MSPKVCTHIYTHIYVLIYIYIADAVGWSHLYLFSTHTLTHNMLKVETPIELESPTLIPNPSPQYTLPPEIFIEIINNIKYDSNQFLIDYLNIINAINPIEYPPIFNYLIENFNNHIDLINFDSTINTNNLSQLNFDPKIKLAIMTKKKIWIDLFGGIERNDLYGDNCPWNLKFVPDESTHPFINSTLNEKVDNNNNNNNVTMSQENISSLVRLNSNLRPWKFNSNTDTQANLDQSLLTPCGKLSRGQNYSDLQYVIKGWCDKRFQ